MFNSSHGAAKAVRGVWVSRVCPYVWEGGRFVVSQCHLLNNESPVKSVTPVHVCLCRIMVTAVAEN